MSDWRWKLRECLIAAGTEGLSQSQILRLLVNDAVTSEIVPHLEALKAEDKVQKFRVGEGMNHRPKTVWRATTLLLED